MVDWRRRRFGRFKEWVVKLVVGVRMLRALEMNGGLIGQSWWVKWRLVGWLEDEDEGLI